ncbi:unnamed protein product [Microthlaspi erraticum]|uniref:Peptidase A1 domain-containing protein n=1 Tax=Microthlaspi erraticum TaxID=1685480 RepID=A0A6D2L6I8_9BRAS|nr:unnamed protein product [Microthlaspi erraticum]
MSDAGFYESYVYEEHKMICYEGEIPEDKKIQFSLHFGTVTLDMETTTLFVQDNTDDIDEETFCLSVHESPLEENLIGIPIFQGRNIGFDVPNNKLYIQAVECHKLYDGFNDELAYRSP